MGIFVTIFLIGLILSLIMLALNFIGDLDMFGGDVNFDTDMDLDSDLDFDSNLDGGQHQIGFSFISPFMISFWLMGIGMGGTLLDEYYSVEPPVLYGGAFILGLAVMLVMQKILRAFFVNTQFNSTVKNKDLIGATGGVSLRIPKGDIGEVVVSTRLGRIKMAARADEYIPEGSKVRVVEKVGNTLMVEAIEKPAVPEKKEAATPAGEKPDDARSYEEKKEKAKEQVKEEKKEEDSSFTFEAYRKKEEAKKPTVIYDQRNITIKDSIISRSDFSEINDGDQEEPSVARLKDSIKKDLKEELYKEEN